MSPTARHPLAHGEARIQVQGPEDGRPVLMIHGLTYPLEVWGPVAERLAAEGNRVVTFDLYGRGESDWDGTDLSTSTLAEQSLAVMDAVGFRGGVNVVSLTTSDLVALWLASMVPERIRTVALLAPTGLDPRARRGSVGFSNRPWLRGISAALMVRRQVRRVRAHRADAPADLEPLSTAVFQAAADGMDGNPVSGRAILSHMASWPSTEEVRRTTAVLSDLKIPTTAVIYGEAERVLDEGVAQMLAGLVHVRRIDVVEGGRMSVVTNPQATVEALSHHFTGRRHTP